MKLDNDLAAYIKKKLINRAALRAESPSKFTEAGLRLVSPRCINSGVLSRDSRSAGLNSQYKVISANHDY